MLRWMDVSIKALPLINLLTGSTLKPVCCVVVCFHRSSNPSWLLTKDSLDPQNMLNMKSFVLILATGLCLHFKSPSVVFTEAETISDFIH